MKVVLEALKGEKTTAEITAKYGIHSTQINNWRKAALELIPEAFSSNRKRRYVTIEIVWSGIKRQARLVTLFRQTTLRLGSTIFWIGSLSFA